MTQKKFSSPSRRLLTLAVGAALAGLAVLPAQADPLMQAKLFRDSDVLFRDADMARWADNYIELGIGWNSENSFRFGQFSGLTDNGAFPMIGFNWQSRDGADDAEYWRVYGATLGLDSRKLQAEGGVQGKWSLMASVDQLKRYETETAKFVHQGLGGSELTLPTGFAALGSPPAGAQNWLTPFEVVQGRDIYRLGGQAILGEHWDFKLNLREDHRDGNRLVGLVFANSRAAIVPYMIEDRTQQLEAVLSYATQQAQFQLNYSYSRYENQLDRFRVQNPYTLANTAQYGLMPDNDYHQISATGAYNFSKDTRLTAQYVYGVARQNESFLPYTTDTMTGPAMPRGSLDGRVDKTVLDIALTAKPVDRMNLKLAYQYRDNDNKTPIAQYVYAGRDTAQGTYAGSPPVGTAVNTASVRSNAPMSTREHKYLADADYEIGDRTHLRATLEHRQTHYTLSDRTETETNRFALELRRPVSEVFLGSVGYAYTQRRGSEYDKNVFFRSSYTDPTYQDSASAAYTAHPSSRSYMFADYDEDRVRASGNWTVSETVTLQGGFDHYEQRFQGPACGSIPNANVALKFAGVALPDSCLGRQAARGVNVNVDLQWQPDENMTAFAFYNYGEFATRQAGREFGSVAQADGDNGTRDWYANVYNRDQTVGFGLKWQPEEQWDFGGSYVFTHGQGKVHLSNGTSVATTRTLPDTWNKLHSLQLFAKWNYSKKLTWRFNYMYESLRQFDWAYDMASANPVGTSSILLTGQGSPKYDNHVIGVSAAIHSW